MATDGRQPSRNPELAALGGGAPAGPEALEVIQSIHGEEIEQQLIELARIGGSPVDPLPQQSERYATNRIALSEDDRRAQQEFIIPRLTEAGASVTEHPLGVIGTFQGKDPSLPPILIMSHTDTVKNGDMYDGVTGVLSGIGLMQAMKSNGYQPQRSIAVGSVTGEESAGFNMALFGSKGWYLGLNDADLAMRNAQGQSIGDLLGSESDKVRSPLFGNDFPKPAAVIELHVEQGKYLEATDPDGSFIYDIGVVEAIAAPQRFEAVVGDLPLSPDVRSFPHEKYLKLTVNGKADHSGATPMKGHRADGLVETAGFLNRASSVYGMDSVLSIGKVEIEGGGMMNTIPGVTSTLLRLAGDYEHHLREAESYLHSLAEFRNSKRLFDENNNFSVDPISIEEVERPEEAIFFRNEEMLPRQLAAFGLVRGVRDAALANAQQGVVGTVGVFDTTADGKIIMKIDVRGISSESRADTISVLKTNVGMLSAAALIKMSDPLPGSGEPVQMDPGLVKAADDTIARFETARSRRMISAAGHDAQNAARAGIPTVMLFCRSKDGVAHNPNAYTGPEDLEKGARSLGALTLSLAG